MWKWLVIHGVDQIADVAVLRKHKAIHTWFNNTIAGLELRQPNFLWKFPKLLGLNV